MVYCNEAYINLWEIEKKELRDYKKNYNLLYDSNFIEYRSDIRKVVEKGKPLKRSPKKMIVATKPDKEIYVAATFYPVIQKGDSTNEIMLIQENVGPLLYTNAELRKKIKEVTVLNDALDASSIIIEFDREGVITRANEHFHHVSKYSKEDIGRITMVELRSGNMECSFYTELDNTINSGKIWKGEMENRTKTGMIYWTDTTIVPLKNTNGKPISFLTISNNINERKIAEQEIKKLNEKLEKEVVKRTEDINRAIAELEAFSYSVSHDLRAPLRAITGFAGLLNEEYSAVLNHEAKRYLSIIQNGTKQMSQLIDDLLQFSRVGRAELQKNIFDPSQFINELIKKERGNCTKETVFTIGDLPPIYGDSNMLNLVFSNLILNAIKFSKEAANPRISIGFLVLNGVDTYFVKDNGVGFDMRYSDKLFKVFQRLHSTQEFEGTGVGLAIVARIVQKHGGKVWGESHPGTETAFYFNLPNKKEDE
jgi:PAS domain S-box-containing protein